MLDNFTLSNARWFYSSKGDPLGLQSFHKNKSLALRALTLIYVLVLSMENEKETNILIMDFHYKYKFSWLVANRRPQVTVTLFSLPVRPFLQDKLLEKVAYKPLNLKGKARKERKGKERKGCCPDLLWHLCCATTLQISNKYKWYTLHSTTLGPNSLKKKTWWHTDPRSGLQ